MTSELTYQDTLIFAAPIRAVFDALWAQPNGALLEVSHISGTPRSIGQRTQARIAFGGVDLLMIETVTAMTAPTHLQIVQQPDGFRRYDPTERKVPFLDSTTADLDAAFNAQFGADPAETQVDFQLHEDGEGTHVQIELAVLTDQKVGWLRKRRWRKVAAKEVAEIIAGIDHRL